MQHLIWMTLIVSQQIPNVKGFSTGGWPDRLALTLIITVSHFFHTNENKRVTCGYTGVLLFDAIVVTIRVLINKTVCRFLGFLAVCLIFWFELHARWLDWCQIGSLGDDSFGGNPCCGNEFWVRGLAQ